MVYADGRQDIGDEAAKADRRSGSGPCPQVEDDRYCIDIVTQLSAVRAALRRAEEEILADHVAHCVEQAITSGNKAEQRRKVAELTGVLRRAEH